MIRSPVEVELPSMRLFVSGSAPLRASDFRDFEARLGHTPLERYGLTETMIVTTNPLRGERRAGTVGLPLPGTEVRLSLDGEIEVRGPAVMKAYWREPQAPPASTDGFFATGDLGQCDERGYLVVVGRKKELILVGGSNVVPGEVERALGAEPGVEEIAAIGLPDADLGEIVAAFVVAREGEEERGLERRLRARAERDLAPYKRPRVYRCVDALPRNQMGKVDRRALAIAASG
jgi:malonyl-CoA/methylmalonyl-CoA synthetase